MWVTRDEAIDHFLFEAASRRNVSAAKLLDQRRRDRIVKMSRTADADALPPEDEAALLRAVERRLRGRGRSDGDPPPDGPELDDEPGPEPGLESCGEPEADP